MKKISWQSQEYYAALSLRNQSLNIPSHLTIVTTAPIQEKKALHIVALIEGSVVGTLFLDTSIEATKAAQIKQVAVSPNYRGRRIGKHLLEYAETMAKKQGITTLLLTARSQAWHFYEKNGYQAIGNSYQKKTLLMQLYVKRISD